MPRLVGGDVHSFRRVYPCRLYHLCSAVVLKGMFGIEIMTSIIAISALTGFYTMVGGLLAVVVTESIQAVLLMTGAICITVIGLYHVGGWSGLVANTEPIKMAMLRPTGDPSNLPWYSVILGYPVIGIWYWCADQTIVQRILGAKDENHARVGPSLPASSRSSTSSFSCSPA